MTEMYTIQRYLQYDRLQEMGMGHFDCWASRFGGSFRRPLGRGGFWRGNIAENQLGQLFIVSIPPLL